MLVYTPCAVDCGLLYHCEADVCCSLHLFQPAVRGKPIILKFWVIMLCYTAHKISLFCSRNVQLCPANLMSSYAQIKATSCRCCRVGKPMNSTLSCVSALTSTFGELSNDQEVIEPLIRCLYLCFQLVNYSLAYYHSRTGSNHY